MVKNRSRALRIWRKRIIRREHFGFMVASFIAISLFALNYSFRGGERIAHAAAYNLGVYGSYEMEQAYPERIRKNIGQNISNKPDFVLRLSGRDVYEVLDKPEFVRRDLPTVVWQYRTPVCVLDLYFTASGENVLAEPVEHFEMRPRRIGGSFGLSEERACISSLIKPRDSFSIIDAQAFYKADL